MRFNALVPVHDPSYPSIQLLSAACKVRDIEFRVIESHTYDYSMPVALTPSDLLYSAWDDIGTIKLEKSLLNGLCTNFYKDYRHSYDEMEDGLDAILAHSKAGLAIIPSFFALSLEKKKLRDSVDFLGGFPVILKILGGSHGLGVLKMDSFDSLFSVVEYLHALGVGHKGILRKFIHNATHLRCIVLGHKVIDCVEYLRPQDDFRTNARADIQVAAYHADSTIQTLAVSAIEVLGLDFGGVDILLDENKRPYIAEVNLPCFFPRCQLHTGTDIAGMMVDFLVQKSLHNKNP